VFASANFDKLELWNCMDLPRLQQDNYQAEKRLV